MSEAAVVCNICGSAYTLPEDEVLGNLPRVVLCSHIFCTTCLRALESPQNVITCPECEIDTSLGEDGVDGLEVDSRIVGLIYTARMNTKKGHSGGRWKSQRLRSPPSTSDVYTQEIAEMRPDQCKVLDEALMKATENLNKLDSLSQTLVNGIQAQLKKERSRIIRQIDDAVNKAKFILLRRRSALMSKLSAVDLLFSTGRKECKRIEERVTELRTAIQKAQHVRRVPSLGTYCNLDEILETLHIPVDIESYDMSALSLRSGLRCSLQVEGLTECFRNYLEIINEDDVILEEVTFEPFQSQAKAEESGKGVEVWDNLRLHATGNDNTKKKSPQKEFIEKNADSRKFIEDSMEYTDACTEMVETGRPTLLPQPRPKEKHRMNKKHRRFQLDKSSTSHAKFARYVMISHIENPGNFYVRYMMEYKSALRLTQQINAFCSEERSLFTISDEIKTDSLLFVWWKADTWCRVRVTELFQKESIQNVPKCRASEVSRLCLFFLDHGFSKGLTIPSNKGLCALNECVRKPDAVALSEMNTWIPMAIRCSLKDIIPSDLVRGWSTEASDEMRSLLGSEAVEMQVFGDEGGTLLVDLKKAPMVSLREHLVFMEMARFYCPMAAPGSSKPLLFYPPVHPKQDVEVNAVVSHMNTPSDFYVQLVENMEYFLLHSKLQDCYGPPAADSEFQIYCPSLSQACVARYDQEWYRAQVTGFPGGRMVDVRYVDFGYKNTISVKDLRQIKDEFFALPEMAVWCSLADVSGLEDVWSDEACKELRELVESKLVTVVAKKLVSVNRPVPVCLFEISEDGTGPSIGEMLVRKGLGVSSKQALGKDLPSLEMTVWDPPFEAELPVELTPPSPASEELKPTLTLPTCLKDIRVRVTHVTSPGNICVQLLQFDCQLNRIHDILKNLYSKSEPQEMDWEKEMFCAANNTGVWERGQVCSMSSSSVAEVLRCDFGSMVKLSVNNLRPLRPDLIGSYLLECNLSGIRPAGGRSTWTATACDTISHFLTGATAIMTIKDPAVRPVLISLFCSNRAGENISIADFLISEGLALKERKDASTSQNAFSEECVLNGENTESQRTPPQTPPTPAPRFNPPPENVRTHSYPPPDLPPCGHTFMSISAISDQGVIYAMTHDAVCEFDRLRERLQQHIKTLPRQKNFNWKGVLGCAVMGTDMYWYRGHVLEVIGGHVKVRYVDQGLVESIPVCHVYPVVLCEDVPQLCVPCQINGVIPIGKGWQLDAVMFMKELLLGRSVNLHIMEHPEDPCGCVTVEMTVDGMALSKIMVHHQYATFDPDLKSQEEYVVKPPIPDLDDWDINTEGLNEPQPVAGVYTEFKIPKGKNHFSAKVKHIRSPNEVFLCVLDKTGNHQEESLEDALDCVNDNVENLSLLTDFPIECPCLAEYSDGKYYRAKLLGFSECAPTLKLLVRHVDFGSDDSLPVHKLRQLPASLLHFPCAAVYVRLAGFKPPRIKTEQELIPYCPQWTMKAMLEMIDLLNGELTAVVISTEPKLTVLLYNTDGSLVHTPLVEKGLADYDQQL